MQTPVYESTGPWLLSEMNYYKCLLQRDIISLNEKIPLSLVVNKHWLAP